MEDLTRSGVQKSLRMEVLRAKKVPLQGFASVPAASARVFFCNVEVNATFTLFSCATFRLKKL
jgi:hypothetical protein